MIHHPSEKFLSTLYTGAVCCTPFDRLDLYVPIPYSHIILEKDQNFFFELIDAPHKVLYENIALSLDLFLGLVTKLRTLFSEEGYTSYNYFTDHLVLDPRFNTFSPSVYDSSDFIAASGHLYFTEDYPTFGVLLMTMIRDIPADCTLILSITDLSGVDMFKYYPGVISKGDQIYVTGVSRLLGSSVTCGFWTAKIHKIDNVTGTIFQLLQDVPANLEVCVKYTPKKFWWVMKSGDVSNYHVYESNTFGSTRGGFTTLVAAQSSIGASGSLSAVDPTLFIVFSENKVVGNLSSTSLVHQTVVSEGLYYIPCSLPGFCDHFSSDTLYNFNYIIVPSGLKIKLYTSERDIIEMPEGIYQMLPVVGIPDGIDPLWVHRSSVYRILATGYMEIIRSSNVVSAEVLCFTGFVASGTQTQVPHKLDSFVFD